MSMNRAGLSCVIVTAMLAVACGSDEGPNPSPTAPTPSTPPATTPAPAPAPSCAPAQVTGLNVSLIGDSTRVFTWNASSGATQYDIQIGTASGKGDIIFTNTSNTTYTWAGVGTNPATNYYARVHARNSCGQAPPSNEIVFY
jgi:fibronectin type III domain protein